MSDALVETIDIAPTLLEAAGLTVPEAMQGRSLDADPDRQRGPGRAQARTSICEFNDAMGGHADQTPRRQWCSTAATSRWSITGTRWASCSTSRAIPDEFDNLWDAADAGALKLERLKYHVDAMMATISVGPPRYVDY